MTPLWVRISEYAILYSTNRKTVYKWLEAGLLDQFRVGRCIRVRNVPPAETREPRVIHNRASIGMIVPRRP
jgi:hypothetical protein